MPRFRIQIKQLSNEPLTYAESISADWLREELSGTDLTVPADAVDGTVSLTLSLSGEDVVIQGSAQAALAAECARCLEPVPMELSVDLTTLMTALKKNQPPPDDDDLTPEDLAREFFEGDEIILDDMIRESLILEVPMQVHCTREECVKRWEQAAPPTRLSPFAALKKLKN